MAWLILWSTNYWNLMFKTIWALKSRGVSQESAGRSIAQASILGPRRTVSQLLLREGKIQTPSCPHMLLSKTTPPTIPSLRKEWRCSIQWEYQTAKVDLSSHLVRAIQAPLLTDHNLKDIRTFTSGQVETASPSWHIGSLLICPQVKRMTWLRSRIWTKALRNIIVHLAQLQSLLKWHRIFK